MLCNSMVYDSSARELGDQTTLETMRTCIRSSLKSESNQTSMLPRLEKDDVPLLKCNPTVPLKWYAIFRSGGYGPFGRTAEVNQRFECWSNGCGSRSCICGKQGECLQVILGSPSTLLDSDETFGLCSCEKGYVAHFCDFLAAATSFPSPSLGDDDCANFGVVRQEIGMLFLFLSDSNANCVNAIWN